MPRGKNQKIKLLVLLRFLRRESDEHHPVTMQQLLTELERAGISAERKSVYDDLETLRDFGYDIVKVGTPVRGYFLGEREFELAELKLLVDAVQSSRFLTGRKSRALIGKMESMTSRWQAGALRRQVHVADRIKTMNESIYYNIDTIHAAISEEKCVSFVYFEWVVDFDKQEACRKQYRHGGERYCVSPWVLMWDNQNYYLVAYDAKAKKIKHYRVDKMERLEVKNRPRAGQDSFAGVDLARYTQSVFGMYGGEVRYVELRFVNSLIGAVVDRFGKALTVSRDGEDHFRVTVPAAVSPQFFGWLAGFGEKAQLLSPQNTAQEYKSWLSAALDAMQ